MNTKIKKVAIAGLSAVLAATLCTGLLTLKKHRAMAETEPATVENYFYKGLSDGNGVNGELAKKFYDALDSMAEDDDFKDGTVDYSLSEILTSDKIKEWVTGNDITIPKSFSAARDAYLTDHPEIFYIDFYKLTISAALSDDVYSAYIDSGREADLYYDGDFNSEAEVNAAIKKFDGKIAEIVAAANKAADDDQYGTNKDAVKARYVNTYLLNNIEYDDQAAISDDVAAYAHSRTAYGGIVNGVAVCSGYSRAYKVVMDELGIPCLCISGYSLGKDTEGNPAEGTSGHEWNYVWLEDIKEENGGTAEAASDAGSSDGGKWYAVDVTWNSTGNNPIKYMGNGSLSINKDHVTDGVISTSGYELKFPELSEYDYGCVTNSEGISHSFTYTPYGDGSLDDNGYELMATYEYLSYNGKGAKRLLEEDGLRMIFRFATYVDGQIVWYPWFDISNWYKLHGEYSGFEDFGTYTRSSYNTSALYTQFAITDYEPDLNYKPGDDPSLSHRYNIYFSQETESEWGQRISVVSDVFENQAFGTYVPAPYLASSTPSVKELQFISSKMVDPNSEGENKMDAQYAFTIEAKYNEPLHVIDENKDIGISYVGNHFPHNIMEYSFLVPLESGKMVELVDDYTLRFKFCPSLMFEHDGERYNFSFTNVGSKLTQYKKDGSTYISDKLPNTIGFSFARSYTACNKCLPGGRLYVDCVARPTLMSDSDLSKVDFINPETQKPYTVDQRSQMMLVADKVTEATESAMLTEIDGNDDIDISSEDIITSETYDIELRICGKIASIPNGSLVKISLGFPEGYGPDDEGVTFRIYHYKHDDAGNFIGVEEIPCVVTRFGIVATVKSFSPYMVAVVPTEKISDKKSVYANVDGNGGKLSAEDGAIKEIGEGETYTCTIAPDSGYQLYTVTLNGKDVTTKVNNGKLTVGYEELDSNNLVEIKFIANGAVKRVLENNIISPALVVVNGNTQTTIGEVIATPDYLKIIEDGTPNNNGAVIAIVIIIAVLAIGGAAIAIVVIKKKKTVKAAASAPKAKKPTAKK